MNDAFGTPQTVLVLGGGSDIARAILHRLAPRGVERLILATPNADTLRARLELEPLPVEDVTVEEWDARDAGKHEQFIDAVAAAHGDLDVVICAVGLLGHHSGIDTSSSAVDNAIRVNFSGPAAALVAVARKMVDQGHGTIVVLSSVAGERPRRSNFVYGSAKAGLDAFAQGLTDAVIGTGVTIHVIRPGFVRSKMTEGLPEAPFTTDVDVVAMAVVDALTSGRSSTRWVPAKLRVMFVGVRHLPRPLWRRIAGDR
jgi:decaprenylphospho-beta-D-erythro-pentofuranosid-2-ulose 2-reductase